MKHNIIVFSLGFLAILAAGIYPLLAVTAAQYPANDAYNLTATVAVDTTTSGAVDLLGTDLAGIFIPSTFDGTAITLTASDTVSGTYVAVQIDHTSAAAYTITTAASKFVPIANQDLLRGLRFFKIVTSTTQTTTSTVFTLATRPQ